MNYPALRTGDLFMMRRYAGIGLLIVGCAAALVYQTRRLGLTVDESSHFAAAYMYWLGEDVLQPADAPPLTRAICGWMPRLLGAPHPRDTSGWKDRDAYMIGAEILDRPNIRARRLLFYTRLPFLFFPLLIVFLLWHWGRQLFGEPIGLFLAACGALEPTIQGHGVLISSDVPAAFGALWFAYTAWKYWCTPNLRRLLILSLATAVAVLIKFTLLPLAAVGFGLVIWKGPRLGAIAIPLTVYVGVLAASQFQADAVPPAEVQQFSGAGVPHWALPGVKLLARLPWPLQFVRGLLYIGGSLQGDGFTGYMLGRKIQGWVPLYFPLAWAIKFPIPLQLLTVAGLAALCVRIRRRKAGAADVLVWGLAAFFFGSAVLSNFHVGFRHVLPALPFFILGGGFALARWGGHRAAAWRLRSRLSGSPSPPCASTRRASPTSTNGLAARRKAGDTSRTAISIGVRTCPTSASTWNEIASAASRHSSSATTTPSSISNLAAWIPRLCRPPATRRWCMITGRSPASMWSA